MEFTRRALLEKSTEASRHQARRISLSAKHGYLDHASVPTNVTFATFKSAIIGEEVIAKLVSSVCIYTETLRKRQTQPVKNAISRRRGKRPQPPLQNLTPRLGRRWNSKAALLRKTYSMSRQLFRPCYCRSQVVSAFVQWPSCR